VSTYTSARVDRVLDGHSRTGAAGLEIRYSALMPAFTSWRPRVVASVLGVALLAPALTVPVLAQAQPTPRPYEPTVGQGGKDVVWVPTPPALVEKMLDMAKVTKDDLVMDLGSGDGRNIIAAAKRGARAIGVEYNPDMVNLSRQLADEAGVGARATFIEGDMFTADISKATVMALFLLPTNLERLRDTFLALRPGTRMVLNTFAIPEWDADASESIGGDCVSWCTSLLYYVPAKVDGRWRTARGELALSQTYQKVSGTLAADGKSTPVTGRLRGTELELTVGSETLRATVAGDRLEGALAGSRIVTR
jgi:SAM-dependent methyltransferase